MRSEPLIRVVIVDDDEYVRAGIVEILADDQGIEIVGEAEDGLEAVRLSGELEPGVVVMDLSMPLVDGVRATRHLAQNLPQAAVLILSSHSETKKVREVIDAGAAGYVIKGSARRELVVAVRSVANGQIFFSPNISSALLKNILVEPAPGR